MDCLNRAVALQPNDANTYNTLCVALLGIGKADEAYAAVRKALELDPKLTSSHSNLGMSLADRGDLAISEMGQEVSILIAAHDGDGRL